jgi:hypothetical protein
MNASPQSAIDGEQDSAGHYVAKRRRLVGQFAILVAIAALLATVGLTSCTGLTSPNKAGVGNPGALGAGILKGSSTSLSYGKVPVGSKSTQTLTFTNTGTGTVNIASADISGDGFSAVGGSPLSAIAVGQSGTIQIQFAPPSAGTVSGTLRVGSDAANLPLTVSLTGTGTQAALTVSPAALNFGNVTVGQSSTQTVSLTNSGNLNVVVNLVTLSGGAFTVSGLSLPATVAAGQILSFNVRFSPSTGGGVAGNITVTDTAPDSPQVISLSASGVASSANLVPNPGSFAFGNVAVGTTASQAITLSNTGNSSVKISSASVGGLDFAMTGLATPKTLAAGQNATFTAQFAPTKTGIFSGTIVITSDASDPSITIPLTANGTRGQLSANPASINFGSLVSGASASVPVTLTNTGTANVVVSSASASGLGFSISGLATPVTLIAGQGTSFTAKFAPTTAGNANGSITIASNAPNSPITLALSGVATAQPQPRLTMSPTSVNFSNVNVGSSGAATITLSNPGNANTVLSQITTSGIGFSVAGLTMPATIAPGGSTSFIVKFSPTAKGSPSGNISISSNAPGSPASITLGGTGVQAQLTASPASTNFGSVITGSSNSQMITLKNGGTASVTITQANTAGAGINTAGLSVPVTIAAGGTTSFNIVFAPMSAGTVNGSVSLVSNAPNSPMGLPVSGTGTASTALLSAIPASLPFGNVTVGGNGLLTTTLINNGNSNISISNVTFTGAGFSGSGVSSGMMLGPGQAAVLTVTFLPAASGLVNGNVAIASSATGSPTNVSLSGTGASVGAHSVALSWDASVSSGVVGYFVYRGNVSGGPYTKLNPAADASLNFTDPSVTSGQTYFYVVTAVDGSNDESGLSSEVSAQIP